MKKAITMLFLISLFQSCENIGMDNFYVVEINNSLSKEINYYVANNDNLTVYPDTTLPDYEYFGYVSGNVFLTSDKTWAEEISSLKGDTLSVYFIDPDTVSKYTYGVVRQQYNILKRYDLSIEDLERLEYRVNYPPDERMEGIKSFPKD